jgi:hypothetical protein
MKILDAVAGLLPPWLPLAISAGLALGLAGALVALEAAWQAEGRATAAIAGQKAIIDQQKKDAALSAALVSRQAEQLANLSARANTIVRRIENAPKTTGCGPVMRDASRGVRELFDGKPDAGRQPAAAVPGSGTRAGP